MNPKILIRDKDFSLALLPARDASLVVEFEKANKNHLTRFDTNNSMFLSQEFWEAALPKSLNDYENGGVLKLFILDAGHSEIIGFVNFLNEKMEHRFSADLAFGIGSAWEGKGLMKRALKHAIDYSFSKNILHKITAHYHPENTRCQFLLQNLGFVREGISRQALLLGNDWTDLVQVSLINENFKM